MACRGMPYHTNRPLNPLSASTTIPPLHSCMFGGDGNTRGGVFDRFSLAPCYTTRLALHFALHDIAECSIAQRRIGKAHKSKAIVESYEIDSRL